MIAPAAVTAGALNSAADISSRSDQFGRTFDCGTEIVGHGRAALSKFATIGSIVPSTEAMHHVGEKPWDPIRFDVYPDEANHAAGSLYEDDGLTPAYKTGAFRRTSVTWQAGELKVSAVEGKYMPPARTFEFLVHGVARGGAVEIDGHAADSGSGTFDGPAGITRVSLRDDGREHVLRIK